MEGMTSSPCSTSVINVCYYTGQDRSQIKEGTTHVEVVRGGGSQKMMIEIPVGALRDLCLLVHVNLPQGLTVIAESAFKFCPSLRSILFPGSLREIRAHAFEYCTNLSSDDCGSGLLDLPEGLRVVGDQAFSMSCQSVQYLQLPSSLASIGRGSFSHWPDLISVGLHEGGNLTTIGDYAFYGGHALTNVAIPSTVSYVGRWAFGRCLNLQHLVNGRAQAVEEALKSRFEGFPLHKRIYFDNQQTSKEMYHDNDPSDRSHWLRKERLGMTPLILLLLSPKPRYDDVPVLLEECPGIVAMSDRFGETAAHYACRRRAPVSVIEALITGQMNLARDDKAKTGSAGAVVPLPPWSALISIANQVDAIDILQLLLRLQLEDRLESLRLVRWKREIEEAIHSLASLLDSDGSAKRLIRIQKMLAKLERCERVEAISNLELAAWKASFPRQDAPAARSAPIVIEDRYVSYIYGGSQSIVQSVVPFLPKAAGSSDRQTFRPVEYDGD